MDWSENGSDDLWIGEMGLSARNGETVDWRNEGGSEKNEIGVRNVFRKLTVSVDWIGAWIEVDRSGSEWIGVWVGIRSEWIGADRSVGRNSLGVDRSLARERIGAGFEWIGVMFVDCVELRSWVDRSGSARFPSSASSLDRYWAIFRIGAWLRRVVSGSELDRAVRVWEARACERGEETNWSENNDWNQFQSFLAYFSVKLKMFSVWPNFTAQPNARFSENWFPEINFSRNKRSLSEYESLRRYH